MRTRPIGPGVGGLYYSPLLQDAHTNEEPATRNLDSARREPAARLLDLWRAIVGIARRAGQRLVEARMEQAQRQLDLAVVRYRINAPAEGRGPAGRYY